MIDTGPNRSGWFAWLMVLALAAGAVADEPARLNLLTADSLAGWQYGSPVQGWKVAGTTLTGAGGSSKLLSGYSFGDFTLHFQWKVAPGASLILTFPESPSGEGLTLTLDDTGQATLIGREGGLVAGGEPVDAGTLRTVHLERTGDRLKLRFDKQAGGSFQLDASKRYGLGLAADGGEVTVTDMTMTEPAGEPIFNGRDLTGWWSPLGLKSWQAKDGAIECLHKDGNYLRTEKMFGNFTLSLEYKAAQGCNSGIGIRTAREGWPSNDGFELQILDAPGLVKDSTMAIYRNLEPLARADRSEEWNNVVIKADGPMISAWVNGQLVQQADTALHPELRHRHLEGWIGLQDHGKTIEFRNLRVLEAPAGLGLPAWSTLPRDTGPEVICQRLLNPERLSLPDGSTSGVVATSTGGESEQTVADLTGPGIVTRIWRSQTGGRLAFYFDGAKAPALEFPAGSLPEDFPSLFPQHEPILACLPYASSLKIVLSKAKPTDYRIEYVTFPADVPIESYQPDQPVLPRGWLAAIDYRGHQYSWGTHREADLEPRTAGEVKSLDPGQSAEVISRPGKGIVQWLKLQTSVAALAKDDLWLEVLVDGQSEPAIAAPARYLFPSLRGGSNHESFLAVFREGFTSMLAMPFTDGIKIRARNAGDKPLKRAAVTLSVIEDEPSPWPNQNLQIDRRMRLRGVFHRAADAGPWLDFKGAGSLIGLVTQTPKTGSLGIASLEIDGAKVPAWTGATLDAILGAAPDEKEFFHLDAGRAQGLAWRYWQLAPLGFEKSIVISPTGPAVDNLTLFYAR